MVSVFVRVMILVLVFSLMGCFISRLLFLIIISLLLFFNELMMINLILKGVSKVIFVGVFKDFIKVLLLLN